MKQSKKTKKKNLFLRSLVRSGFMIILMFATGLLTYKATIAVYNISHGEPIRRELETSLKQDGKVDAICKNLIYIVDGDTTIDSIILEILNTYTDSVTYITIPQTAQFSLSPDLYKQLYEKSNQIPQIVTIKDLLQYFNKETTFELTEKVMEDLLGTDLSCYTIISKDTSSTYFQEEERTTVLPSGEIYKNKMMVLKKGFLANISDNKDEIYNYIKNFYKVAKSNLMLEQKKRYVATYSRVEKDLIYYYCIPGKLQTGSFEIQLDETKDLISQVEHAQAYTQTQKEGEETLATSSLDKKIEVLNGSKITNMATKYSEILKEAGFQVVAIGNYTDELVEITRIQVREQGVGADLLPYFKDAEIEVTSLPPGIDIQIILGTAENSSIE